jgi:nitrogen-specific signal transduction histidine kinase
MFDKLFPFHFVLDRAFRIVQKGSSLSKIVSDTEVFDQLFSFRSPVLSIENTFESVLSRLQQLFIIEIKGKNFILKGQFVYQASQDLLFFCGNPWLNADTSIRALNLSIGDFAVHSAVIENTQFLSILFEELKSKIELSEDFENQRKFFERLFDEIPVDMSIIDLDKRFKYLNKRAVKDDKLRKWMVGKTNSDYFILKNIDKEIGFRREVFLQQAIDSDSLVSFEDVHHKGTEKEVVMLRSVSPFTAHNGVKYLLAYGQNITELKKNAKLVQQKNVELEKLNLELNNIIYSITHDFRSPILAVKALVELLKKSVILNQRFEGFLDMITDSIDKLDDQIIDIYHFVKNVNSENRFTFINLEEIVNEIFNMVKHSVPYPIELRIDIEEKVVFYSDAYRLKILLNNLISNAVKYSSNRDNNAFVEFIARVDENEAVFYIKDNGEGIPDQLKEKVFDIYFRANKSTSGTGLGLFICSEVVRKLNGNIELESTLGKGSTFRVSIPNRR